MGKHRELSEKNEFYLSKEDRLTAIHWCLRYPRWQAEASIDADIRKAITYNKDKVQTSSDFDPTQEIAIKRADSAMKAKMLEDTIREVDEDLYKYLLLAVGYGFTYYQLKAKNIPCSKNYFYKRRQQIYYLISLRI
ncbi:MAG: hypothetical protein J6I68_15180 [Butyrivibrio sp.]|uniref:hypothetical protein n=1 Tax=Butyrivibrio sp. TaxID=28121 RepID=UPI001B666E5F|nr:hypothetical protein [Butyrivibrio sp.]MBP3784587.1 hypothetical protein [Butyrivibrio sp.]